MAAEQRRLPPPPFWFAIAMVVQRVLTRNRVSTPASRTAAGVIAGGAGLLAVSAVATLTQAGTQLSPEHPEHSAVLVTHGPFRFTRNPVYLALAGVLVAHAVLRRSAFALAPVVGFVAMMDRSQIPAEEHALRSRFTGAYDRYREATPRWVGR